jgi:ring-1,2-phenylacetyl-CoA epoxidase subunit PaaE
MALPKFHELAVREVRRETKGAVSVCFDVPQTLAGAFAFSPGQYLTLRATVDGTDLRRSYSICSGPDDGELRIAAREVESGVFSTWMNNRLKAGDRLHVMTPTGRFGLGDAPGDGRIHVGFAAGSGITPILSIIRGVLGQEPNSRFFLFYGNRTSEEILFRGELESLKDKYMDRLSIFHVLSREEQDIPVLNGRLDGDKARLLLRSIVPAASIDHVFICGPTEMSEGLQKDLAEIGIAPERIHVERFVSADGGKPKARKPLAKASTDASAQQATLIVDGKRHTVPVASGEPILDAALRAGLDLPFACKGGMCSTCRAKVLDGQVKMDVNYSLEDWELKAGFVLTCQSHPATPAVTIDFDQA